MINVNEIRANLDAVAAQLDQCDGSTSALLRDLSYALQGGPQTNAWASSNIHQLIEPAVVIERYKNQRSTDKFIAILEWIRNSLIFAPLVLTWLGISQAVDKYKELIDADHNQISQPFIYLWQQGFGGRLPQILTLGWLAVLDFSILFLVLILTFLVYSFFSVGKLKREQEAENLRSTLTYALAGAALWLTTRTVGQPTNFVDRFNQATQEFNRVVSELLKQVNVLADRLKNDWQSFDTLRTQLATTVSTVSTAVVEIKKSNDTLSEAINNLLTPARDIAGLERTLTQNMQTAITSFKDQTGVHALVIAEQQKWGAALQVVLTKLETTVKVSEGLTRDTGTFVRKQADLVTAMEHERREQAEITSHMVTIMDSTTRLVHQIDKCTIELQGVNVQMNDLVRRVAAMR
jgi:hypothetical protein